MKIKRLFGLGLCFTLLAALSVDAQAAAASLGTLASGVTATFGNLAKLITAGSYLAGLGFAVGSIMKFKQHKDNPTQVPVGTPIALLFVAASLVFLPSIISSTGSTLFAGAASAAGVGGSSSIQ